MASAKKDERVLWSACTPYRLSVDADPLIICDEDGCELPSKTRQEFMEECDVNEIWRRYESQGGKWPPPENGSIPTYVDFVGMPDLQGAMKSMIEAEDAFMSLPAAVRKEFDNDALRFVEFASGNAPDRMEKLRAWGLAAPQKAPPEPISVKLVPEPNVPPGPPPGPPPAPPKAP